MIKPHPSGARLRALRTALGYDKRPQFAEIMKTNPVRLQAIERGSQRLNVDDFEVIAELWPWALEYIAKGGELVIPEIAKEGIQSYVSGMENIIDRIKNEPALTTTKSEQGTMPMTEEAKAELVNFIRKSVAHAIQESLSDCKLIEKDIKQRETEKE